MRTSTSETWIDGEAGEVLDLLTDPDAIGRWAPVPFELLELDAERLEAGSRALVQGTLAGRRLVFDVHVLDAADGYFSLRATGPIAISARYAMYDAEDGGTIVHAAVEVEGRGVTGSVMARATEAVLAAGALQVSLGRLGRELERAPELAFA